ncbi:hypothetical protein [Cereibacter sphaeroides]|jgi:hypothetical protein|uniref:hypothetical protein n=1 Tax=Cereibacter sphaeroides TaxID=1063 RepID=UPI0005C1E691
MAEDLAKQLRDIAVNGDSLFSRRYIRTLERSASRLDALEARLSALAEAEREMRSLEKIEAKFALLKNACDLLSQEIAAARGSERSTSRGLPTKWSDCWAVFLRERCSCTGRDEDRLPSTALISAFREWLLQRGEGDCGPVTASKALAALVPIWRCAETGRSLDRHKAGTTYYRGLAFKPASTSDDGASPRTPAAVNAAEGTPSRVRRRRKIGNEAQA